MSKKSPKLTLVTQRGQANSTPNELFDLNDPQTGALAEAEAIADVMEVLAVDKLDLCDDHLATLSHLLRDRLKAVRSVIGRQVEREPGGAA